MSIGPEASGEERMTTRPFSVVAVSVWIAVLVLSAGPKASDLKSHAKHGARTLHPVLLASGLQGASGSALGPGGALYVTEGATGRILRVDPQDGTITTFATGLPKQVIPLGGAIDVAFLGGTAYVLVTLVGPDVGGSEMVGIYRVDGPQSITRFADIGEFVLRHPPDTPFDVPTGLQYAIEPFGDGFLVTDGHHNRVLRVTLDGVVSEFRAFGNIVPTGLAAAGHEVYMAQAGPVPHLPQTGKIVSFRSKSRSITKVASGASLLVDVEFGRGQRLYALSQGRFPEGGAPAEPALPNTGALLRVREDGRFAVIVRGLNQPTSLEFIGDTAYIVTLGGEVWTVEGLSAVD